jgi:peptidoglycan/xylan/chitin deacetylase (PgdA/CDA1 family)
MTEVPHARKRVSRRAVLFGAAGVGLGATGAIAVPRMMGWNHPPLAGGYAAAADALGEITQANVTVRYFVKTTEPVVAFTFDDGPAANWTPMALDALEAAQVPATFFMVGRNVAANSAVVRDRLAGHEIGNHSWQHDDLATLDQVQIRADLSRTHRTIQDKLGRTPTLLRPPFGHLGGSTLLAADSMGYEVVLWSQQMREQKYLDHPDGQVDDIVDAVRPGSIILCHDVGDSRRLISLKRLGAMFDGLKARGFRFATVSELAGLATGPAPTATASTVPH